MLTGILKYKDFSSIEYDGTDLDYTFNVKAAEFPDALWMGLETTETDIFKIIDVNKMIYKCVKPEKFNEDLSDKMNGSCRIDIGSSVKTNAVNTIFAARIGSLVRYALSVPGRTVLNDNGDLLATDKIGNNEFKVKYFCSVPVEVYIKTDFVELDIKKSDLYEVFPKLQEKNKYGNIVSLTPISNIAVKKTKDFLGFTPPVKEVDDVPEWGLRQTIEEVIAANPNKNTSWILDRHYVIVDKDNVDEVIEKFLKYDGLIAFDTETTGLDVTFRSAQGNGDTIVGLSLSYKAGEGYYFPLAHKKFDNLSDDITYFMQTKIRPVLEGKQIICHNTAFDWKVAYLYGINTNVVFDTMVAFNCTFRYQYGKGYETGLKALAKNILGLDMFDLADFVIGEWGSTDINFSDLPYELVRRYATADADMTLSLYEWLVKNDVLNRYNAVRVHDLEVQFAKVVAYSEYWGYRVDMARLPDMVAKNTEQLKIAEQEMYRLAGHEFNPNSPKQLKQVMYEELGIEKINGQDSTKAEILKELDKLQNPDGTRQYPFVHALLEYRNKEGTNKNFIKKREDFITPDGFIFPHVFQFGTDTGRVSIKEPNYQSYDKLVKHYIVPREGYVHFDCDYSQIEYRVLASMAQQQNLCDALADPDMDYHTYQASRMFNVPYASVTSSLRKQSKGINFGLPYGMEDKSLGKRIFGQATPENTAKAAQLRKKYFQGQEKIQQFFEVVRAQGVAEGYTETWLGRRRYYDKQRFDVGSIRRQAGNHVIQGCVDGDTLIQTKELGIVKIKDIAGTSLNIWNGEGWTHGDVMYSGEKQKCIVRFKGGQEFICSPIHKFLVIDENNEGHWVECKDLVNGSSIRVNANYSNSNTVICSYYDVEHVFGTTDSIRIGKKIGGMVSVGVINDTGFHRLCCSDYQRYIVEGIFNDMFKDCAVVRGFVAGLFSKYFKDNGFDGDTVELTFMDNEWYHTLCKNVQKALLMHGIKSTVSNRSIVVNGVDVERLKKLVKLPACSLDDYAGGVEIESVEITDEYIDMYDVCNTDNGFYMADGVITHNTAADIYKMGVVSMFDMICRNGWLGKVLINAFVHDEILIEIHNSINPYEFLKYWREEYQVKIKGFCQLYAGAGFGENWYVAKSQDLPPGFIQECIDKADTMGWDGDITKFLKQCNEDYFDYKVRRVRDYITDKNNANQVIKPLINALLLEVTSEALNISEKELTNQYKTLDDIILKFSEVYSTYFNNDMQIYKVLPPDAVQQKDIKQGDTVNIAPIDMQTSIVERCRNYGVAVDVDNMIIYLLFVQKPPQVLNVIKGLCNTDTGYKLRFVLDKGENGVQMMNTPYFIKGSDALSLQTLYKRVMNV